MSTPHSERLLWHRLPGPLPDADTNVLLSVEGTDVWPGFWDGQAFYWADTMPVEGAVLGWADMPEGLEGLTE